MTANDQLNLLRMLRECRRLRDSGDDHAKKWKEFAVTILSNIPVAFLHDYDLAKLQSFTINLTSLKLLDDNDPVLRWAISERYAALRPDMLEALAKGESDHIVSAITQLSLLSDTTHVKTLL